MTGTTSSVWLLTVLFFGVGVWSLIEAVRPHPGDGAGRIGCLWHALMSAAMIAMLSPWGATIPTTLWTIVFGFGAARFAVLTMARRLTDTGGTTGWCHAVAFASMVVMAWAMDLMQHGSTSGADDGLARSAVVAASGGHHHSGAATADGAAVGLGSIQLWCLANAVILLCVGAFLIVGFVNDWRRSTMTPGMTGTSGDRSAWATSAALSTVVGLEVVAVPPRLLVRMLSHVTMVGGMALAFLQMT